VTSEPPARRVEITRDLGRWIARDEDGTVLAEGTQKKELVREVTDNVRASGTVTVVRIFAANGMFLEQRVSPRGEAARRKPRH